MRHKDNDGLAAIAALRDAESRLSGAVQCVARTMDTIDILHARVAELEATIKRGDAKYHGLIDERNYHQDRAERLLEELAEARHEMAAMLPVVEAAVEYQRIYSDPHFDPETASGEDWRAEGDALRLLRGAVRAYRAQQKEADHA